MISLFKGKSNTIASAAVIVASFSILSRLVGFIRDRILAGTFGAGDNLDVYFAAFRIPDFLFQLIVVGALSASFIPLFTKYYSKDKENEAWQLTNNILNIIVVIFGVLVLLGILLAPYIAPAIAPGFDAEKQAAVGELSRIMFLAQLFLSVSMVYGSALQGARRFVLYSLAPIFYNIGIISGAVLLAPEMGVAGVAWGVVLGAVLHLFVQWFGVKTLGYKYKFLFNLKNKDVQYTFKHMLPRIMGLAVNQINFLAMTMIASALAIGSVTILQFAYNLNFFPVGVIAVSYAIAAFPSFCEYRNKDDEAGFIKAFSSTVRQMFFFIVPATFVFILLRAQIVRVVLGAGMFDWEATKLTADTLGFFIISLFAQGLIFILARAYFAYSNTITPFLIGVGAAIVNIVVAILLSRNFGVLGLGIAYSISSLTQAILLWLLLRRKLGGLDEWHIFKSSSVLLVAGLLGAVVVQFMKGVVVEYITLNTFFAVFGQGLIAGTAGIFVYGLVAYLFKSEEMMEFLHGMKRRLFKKAETGETIITNIQ
ncbi:MAG: murein biosynthesis integral membrane protein MurJ [Patescibacteria group bacterium]|nr:murein biosynthesis integral membrane protein MurJ [Patescibacteria group bacterium]